MSRPALSATRSFDIIELLSTFPERRFSLSEIVKATNINIASCHAILNAMIAKGYLDRSETTKTYRLGPSLIAVGKAAQLGQPLETLAEKRAAELARELDCPSQLSTMVGNEIVAVASFTNTQGVGPGMQVAERLPVIAPLGVPFLAWGSAEAIEAWMNRRPSPLSKELRAQLHRDLELTRARGYHVSMPSPLRRTLGSLITETAQGRSVADYKEKMSKIIESIDHQMRQPEAFVDDRLYEVQQLVAPIFDQDGRAAFNLSIGAFAAPLTGAVVQEYGDRLTRVCLDIMRNDRALTIGRTAVT